MIPWPTDESEVAAPTFLRFYVSVVATLGWTADRGSILLWLEQLWAAWQAHPDYEWYYQRDGYGFQIPLVWHSPVAVMRFTHDLGIRGNWSALIAPLPDLLASRAWGERTLGVLAGVAPITPDLSVNRVRIAVLQGSPKGGGNAVECRMVLKQLLPRKLHRLVSKARGTVRHPKWRYLPLELVAPAPIGLPREAREQLVRTPALQPAWYRDHTKAELFAWGADLIPHETNDQYYLTHEERQALAPYVDPLRFYQIATGQVRSIEVIGLVRHQRDMFDPDQQALWELLPSSTETWR
ncbi:MAG: hypothetical protein KKB13_18870 [Chloroflexi bacterium]|nr:hypothetical protein [Chloroflexota bacterium]